MKDFFVTRMLRWAGGKADGYKTKIAGGALILGGIIGFVGIMFPDQGLPQMTAEGALGLIGGGLAALGIGGKAEKIKSAIEAQTATPGDGGFIRLTLLLILSTLLLMLLLLNGCATTTTQDMATAAITGKQGIILAAAGTDAGCRTGLMQAQECALALAAYQASQIATGATLHGLLANASDETIRAQLQQAIADGFPQFTFSPAAD